MSINPFIAGQFGGALRKHTEDEYLELEKRFKQIMATISSLRIYTEGEHEDDPQRVKMFLELTGDAVNKLLEDHEEYSKTLLPKASNEPG